MAGHSNGKFYGGPIVKEWPEYFLRDDTEIRAKMGLGEGYSLFGFDDKGSKRIAVYGGTLVWSLLHKNISVVLDEYDTDSFKVRTNSGRDRWIVDDRCATLIPPPDRT